MIPVSRYLCCAALFGVAFAQTEKERAVMLPRPVRIAGVVMDSDGTPLSGISIDHTGFRKVMKTDPQGRFDIETRAPAIVFRAFHGYQSKYWRVSENLDLTITLDRPVLPMKECGASFRFVSLNGWVGRFCLPKVHGVNISKQGNDVDYGRRVFSVMTRSGKIAIEHAAGFMWGPGRPLYEEIWSAHEYI